MWGWPSVSPSWIPCRSALSPVLAATPSVGPSWWGFLILTDLPGHTWCPLDTVLCFLQWVSFHHVEWSDCPPHLAGPVSYRLPASTLFCDWSLSCAPCMTLRLLGIGTYLGSGKRDGGLTWDQHSDCIEIEPQHLIIWVTYCILGRN